MIYKYDCGHFRVKRLIFTFVIKLVKRNAVLGKQLLIKLIYLFSAELLHTRTLPQHTQTPLGQHGGAGRGW